MPILSWKWPTCRIFSSHSENFTPCSTLVVKWLESSLNKWFIKCWSVFCIPICQDFQIDDALSQSEDRSWFCGQYESINLKIPLIEMIVAPFHDFHSNHKSRHLYNEFSYGRDGAVMDLTTRWSERAWTFLWMAFPVRQNVHLPWVYEVRFLVEMIRNLLLGRNLQLPFYRWALTDFKITEGAINYIGRSFYTDKDCEGGWGMWHQTSISPQRMELYELFWKGSSVLAFPILLDDLPKANSAKVELVSSDMSLLYVISNPWPPIPNYSVSITFL